MIDDSRPRPHFRRAIQFLNVTCRPTNIVDALAADRGHVGLNLPPSSYGRALDPSGPRRGAGLWEWWEWGLVDAPHEALYGREYTAHIVQTLDGPSVDLHRYPDPLAFEAIGDELRSVIVLDVETTGLHPLLGDRIVSVAAVAVQFDFETLRIDAVCRRVFTVNPGRESTPEALAVHKLDAAALAGRPGFEDCARDLVRFLSGKGWYEREGLGFEPSIIAHNAPFDIGFINVELARCGLPLLDSNVDVIDTKALSKKLWPNEPSSLDALCERLGVNRGGRDGGHTALGDVELLAACLPGLHDAVVRHIHGETEPDA